LSDFGSLFKRDKAHSFGSGNKSNPKRNKGLIGLDGINEEQEITSNNSSKTETDSELNESIGSVSSDGGDYQDLPIVVDA